MTINEITVQELKSLIESKEDIFIVDVRSADENNYANLSSDAKLIPMQDISERHIEIPRDRKVVVFCHHGSRSRKVIAWLQDTHGFENLLNLEGGIHAWSVEIDTNVPIY